MVPALQGGTIDTTYILELGLTGITRGFYRLSSNLCHWQVQLTQIYRFDTTRAMYLYVFNSNWGQTQSFFYLLISLDPSSSQSISLRLEQFIHLLYRFELLALRHEAELVVDQRLGLLVRLI